MKNIMLFISRVLLNRRRYLLKINEGFMTGNIHRQGSWISTPTGGNPDNVTHQTISTDNATDGSSALKIVRESMYGVQSESIIGGFYNLTAPITLYEFFRII